MKQALILAIFFSAIVASNVCADISTRFSTAEGFVTGQSGFTLIDVNDPGFSLTHSGDGQISFFANPPLYFQSNRTMGVGAGGTATFTFNNTLAKEVVAWGRDTDGDNDNVNNSILGTAIGEMEAFDAQGSLGIFQFTDDRYAKHTFSSASGIISFEVRNLSADSTSQSLLGGLDMTSVPEPSGILVLAMGSLAALVRVRRS